jgi:uracil-DNA glycosylase family 4
MNDPNRWFTPEPEEGCTKPSRCRGCPLYTAPGPIWGYGPQQTDVVMIGEAPGKDEVKFSKRPFTGGSGRVLNSLLMHVAVDRRTVYMTNAVKCRPTLINDLKEEKDRTPTRHEMDYCRPFLEAEIAQANPNLIVALGASALYQTRGRDDIGKMRGFLSDSTFPQAASAEIENPPKRKVLASFHPAALMRQQHMFPLAIEDLKQIPKESTFPEIRRIQVEYRTHGVGSGDPDSIVKAARIAGFVCEDLETTGLKGDRDQILCVGVGTRAFAADCFVWSTRVAEMVRQLHSDPAIEVVGQNVEGFDFPFLEAKQVPYPKYKRFDTLLAAHLINPDLPKDLGTIGSLYTDREYWKDKGRKAQSLQDTMEYCAEDIDGTTRGYLEQKRELAYLGLDDLYYGTVIPLQPVLRAMTKRGVRKDVEKADRWSIGMESAALQKEDTLRKGLNEPFFNVSSPKQLMALFYDKLGLPVQYARDKVKGVRPTANAEAMEKLAEITDDPIFHLVNQIRTLRKWKSTYCEVETDENGFIHPEFGSAKAANGRLNSWNPNAQNWPNELREIIIPDDDEHVFVSADWSQVEWRVEMALSADERGLKMFTEGRDIHKTAATGFTGVPYDAVTKAQRHQMKFVIYGLLYGRSAASIAKQLSITKVEVEKMIAGVFNVFTGVRRHMNLVEKLVAQQHYLRNPFSRRRWWYTQMVTEALNFLPSSTAADMMYIILPKLEAQLPKGSTLRLSVHDEVVVNTPKDNVRMTSQCIKDVMQQCFPQIVDGSVQPEVVKKYYPNGWWVPVDASVGYNWRQCKPENDAQEAELKDRMKFFGLTS